MEPQNQVPEPVQLTPQPPVGSQPAENPIPITPKSKGGKSWKIITMFIGVVIAIAILFSWVGSQLRKKDLQTVSQSASVPLTNNINQTNDLNMEFPTAQYKDFAAADNSDILNPAKANPNLTEYGSPHLEITKERDGYSEVNLPLLGIQLSMPFGWGSKGGFDTMERVDFFPAVSQDALKQAYAGGSAIDLGLKVLNTTSLGVTDFDGVMAKVKEFSSDEQNVTVESLKPKNAFIVKTENIHNSALTQVSSNWTVYIQSPIPDSTAWVSLDIRAPKAEFKKYLGLLGLEYKDIKIDWTGLDAYMKGKTQPKDQSSGDFESRLVDFLHTKFPETKSEPAEEFKNAIHQQALNAQKYGLETEQDIAVYVTTAWLLGEHFDTEFPAAQVELTSKASAQEKAQWLEDWTTKMLDILEKGKKE
jgi:hypothetical protein